MMKSFAVATTITLLFSCLAVVTVAQEEDGTTTGGDTTTTDTAAPYFDELLATERTVYDAWWDDRGADMYGKNIFLPMVTEPANGAAVHWSFAQKSPDDDTVAMIGRNTDGAVVDEADATHIQFAVAVRAEGWLSFGISEAGGMLGSDVTTFTASDPTKVVDGYILEDRAAPKVDDCQNWELVSAVMDDGWMIIEMIRPLDTFDTQDFAIVDDSGPFILTRLIAAWGDSESVSYHGFNVGKIATTLYGDAAGSATTGVNDFKSVMDAQADGFFEIRESNFTIPARETTYHNVCKSFAELQAEYGLPDPGDGTITFIGAEPVLTPETEQYVHHFIVSGGTSRDSCDDSAFMLWGWAPGEETQAFPSDVGIPMFGSGDQIVSVNIQIHYNNPAETPNQIDSSGMRFYFSVEPREHEAAWLQLGDPLTLLGGTDIPDGLTEYTFDCAGSCSSFALGGEPVTVLTETLHMHKSGVRMTNDVIRNNEVINSAKVDVFEFDQQGSFKVQQDMYQIQPGDSFRTKCYYRDGTAFGLSSQEEMCIAFLLYYPAKNLDFGTFGSVPWLCTVGIEELPICKEEMQVLSLASDEELDRTFGTPPTQCLTSLPIPDKDNVDDGDGTVGTLPPPSTGAEDSAPPVSTVAPSSTSGDDPAAFGDSSSTFSLKAASSFLLTVLAAVLLLAL